MSVVVRAWNPTTEDIDRLVISEQSRLQETFSQGIIKKEKYIT